LNYLGADPTQDPSQPQPQQQPSAPGDDQFERQFFSYVLDRAVPGNAVQDPNQLQILSDADFEWWWIIASRTSNLLKVLMKEQATGRDFIGTTASATSGPLTFNGINIDNWAGTALATAAFPLAVPYIMPATRVYTLLFSDTSGGTNNVELVFSGFKLWPRPKVN
jgi:hypothetical protein